MKKGLTSQHWKTPHIDGNFFLHATLKQTAVSLLPICLFILVQTYSRFSFHVSCIYRCCALEFFSGENLSCFQGQSLVFEIMFSGYACMLYAEWK